MKIRSKLLGNLLLLGLFTASAKAASFTSGNIVVEQFGDGSAALSAASARVFVLEYLPSTANQSSPVQTITIPATGSSRLTTAGSSTSEGFLTRSADGSLLTLSGYDADAGTASIAGTASTAVSRAIGELDINGNFTRVATGSSMYTGGNIRSSVSDGINFWTAGSVGGIWYSVAGGVPTAIGGGNFRVTRIFNGNLYYSASTTISAFSGLPTSTATGTATGITSTSIYDFAINPAGTIAYVCDDGALSGVGGIQKWTLSGSTWSKKFTFGTANGLSNGCRSMAVDFSGSHPVIYATDAATLTKLITITDNSAITDTSDSIDQATVLATAVANTAFRGVALAPIAVSLAPVITLQPQDASRFVGDNATFTTAAAGSAPITYQWYYNTNTLLLNQTNSSLTVSNVTLLSAGTYSAIASNSISATSTRYAVLTISSTPIPPTITNQPSSTTVNAGDTATFTVVAGGSPTLIYQWKSIIGGVTNTITNTTSATLTLSGVAPSAAGQYFVTITNSFGSTNSALATLTVNPPVALSISQLRSMVDTNYAPTNTTTAFTITGIVTTWTNMTTSTTSTEFYMQDASGGIAVFWSGASPSTNLPAAGSLVQVTGPMAAFGGLLEIEPVVGNALHSVTVISTNNPLPAALPLPFDPNVAGNLAKMKQFEGMYFVASNVMLNLSTPNFTSGANDYITNNTHKVLSASTSAATINFTNDQGQSFILFVNAATDLPNKAKYTTPVTVYGILGYFTSAGFEFTPSRYADVISYNHVTNVLQNLTRQGDLPTNNFTESVLRPSESLTTDLSVGDPEGGSVTLTPITDGLPASAYWTNVVNGLNAHATFKFSPTSADAGVNYTIALGASSTSGSTFTNYFYVYVPSAIEQQIYISEFLASPTANTNLAYFNPLHRSSDTNSPTVRDQYVEIANLSGSDVDLYGWSVGDASQYNHAFINGAPQELLGAANAIVIYGGATPVASDPNPPILPVLSYPVKNGATGGGTNLALVKSGTGVIVLRNPGYYNDGHGIQPGYIVDRVVYDNAAWPTNAGALTRFPTVSKGFVPESYVSTNYSTPGLQYDGSPWSSSAKIPTGINNIAMTSSNGLVFLNYTANTSLASTLWGAADVTGPYGVIYGFQPTNSAASFSVTNSLGSSKQFFYITTQ